MSTDQPGRGLTSDAPCKCHRTWAYIAPMHDGHCCFQPATATCHPEEVAVWEAERDRRRGPRARGYA